MDTSRLTLLSSSPVKETNRRRASVLVLQEGKPLVLPSVKKAEQKVVSDPSANKVYNIAMLTQHIIYF